MIMYVTCIILFKYMKLDTFSRVGLDVVDAWSVGTISQLLRGISLDRCFQNMFYDNLTSLFHLLAVLLQSRKFIDVLKPTLICLVLMSYLLNLILYSETQNSWLHLRVVDGKTHKNYHWNHLSPSMLLSQINIFDL